MSESPFAMGKTQAHVAWCSRLFDSLREGGEWGYPAAGLIFHKREGSFILTAVMPWQEGMPGSRDEFHAMQQEEFDKTREMFGLAGVNVIGELDDVRKED